MLNLIGIFLASEPRIYDRGIAWMLPLRLRSGFYRVAEHVGFTLRRLLFGMSNGASSRHCTRMQMSMLVISRWLRPGTW